MVGGQRGISACLRSRGVVFTGAPVGSSRGGSSHFTPLHHFWRVMGNWETVTTEETETVLRAAFTWSPPFPGATLISGCWQRTWTAYIWRECAVPFTFFQSTGVISCALCWWGHHKSLVRTQQTTSQEDQMRTSRTRTQLGRSPTPSFWDTVLSEALRPATKTRPEKLADRNKMSEDAKEQNLFIQPSRSDGC